MKYILKTLQSNLIQKYGTKTVYTPPGNLNYGDTEAGTMFPGTWRICNEPLGVTPLEKAPVMTKEKCLINQ